MSSSPARPSRPATASRRAASVLVAAALLAGCGGEDQKAQTKTVKEAEPLGTKLGGSVATLANCADWKSGPRPRQLATVADIRNLVNRTDTGVSAPPLSDDEAVQLFDRACAPPWSKGFRLYVIYTRAAGFAPLLREAEAR